MPPTSPTALPHSRLPGTPRPGAARPGLRERKKIRTRQAIRSAAYRLIGEQGYESTTVEQIARAAEVSPSTVFRYFPVKEDILVTDEYAPLLEAELCARPTDEPVLTSLRLVLRAALTALTADERGELALRADLMLRVPAVRARTLEGLCATGRRLARVLAERTGRDPDDLELRIFVTGVLAALQEASVYWAEHGRRDDLPDLLDRALGAFGRAPAL